MRIPASRFTTLPEGCPVQAGALSGHCGVVATEGRYWFRWPGSREPIEVLPEDMQVDLSTPAAIRAFAPELIAAVKGRTRFTTPQRQPSAVWHAGFRRWMLVDYLTDIDSVVSYEPTTALITGSTPAECIANGLQAALDAAGGAS